MKVLIADDKKHYIAHLIKLCKEYSLECTPETDPQAVVDRIRNKEFYDILIIDTSFTSAKVSNGKVTLEDPKLTGMKILEIAKRTYLENNYTPYIPILNIAAGTKELYRFEQKAGLIFDFIERPFRDNVIRATLEKVVKFLSLKKEQAE